MYYIVDTRKSQFLTVDFEWVDLKETEKSCMPLATRNLEYARTVCAWMSKERSQVSPYSQRRLNKSGVVTQTQEDTLLPAWGRLQCGQLLELDGKKGGELFWAELRKIRQETQPDLAQKEGEVTKEEKIPRTVKVCTVQSSIPYTYTPFCIKAKETLKLFLELCEMMEQRKTEAQACIKDEDKKLGDLMHIAEFSNFSVINGYRVYKSIQQSRDVRRQAKDDLSLMEVIAPLMDEEMQKCARKALIKLDQMDKRTYVTRVMDSNQVAQLSRNILISEKENG